MGAVKTKDFSVDAFLQKTFTKTGKKSRAIFNIENENNEGSSNTPVISMRDDYLHSENIQPIDYLKPPKYKRTLQDIIAGTQLPSLTGTRPLLVILASFSDKAPNATHDIEYFENMMWGPKPSLSTYYSEVSYDKFTFSRGEVIGWYQIDVTQSWAEDNPKQFVFMAVNTSDKYFNFSPYDTNKDGIVTNEELTLVIVHPSDYVIDDLVHHWKTKEIITNDDVIVEGWYSMMTEWSTISR